MVLPFVIPVLIFGVMAAYGAVEDPGAVHPALPADVRADPVLRRARALLGRRRCARVGLKASSGLTGVNCEGRGRTH
jgi:hypothetical protein